MRLAAIASIVFFTFNGYAQFKYPKPEYVVELKKRKLVVGLLDGDSEYNRQANEHIQKYFSEFWKFTPAVEFMDKRNVEAILESNDERYAIIIHEHGSHDMEGIRRTRNGVQQNKAVVVASLNFFALSLYVITNKPEMQEAVFRVTFAHDKLQPADYLFAVQQFEINLNSVDQGVKSREFFPIKENLATMKTKTLLLEREYLKVAEETIKTLYKNPFIVIPTSEFTERVLKREDGYLYSKLIWSEQSGVYMFVIADVATGRIYAQVALGGVNRWKTGETRPAYEMGKAQFKYVVMEGANNVNSRY